jgi:undecaprenyl-diphosphatase
MDSLTQLFYFIVLGVVQGLTEVLPISSSGHLALAQKLLEVDMLTFASAAALHGGSLLAIALWFRRDFIALWRSLWASRPYWQNLLQLFFSHPNEYRVPYFIALSLIPVAIEGLWLSQLAEVLFVKWVILVPIFLVINGGIILITARWSHGEKRLDELTLKEYLLIGIIQGIAVLPGISRLGLTLCAGLWLRLNWYEALRLTFILALPTIAGAIVLNLSNLQSEMALTISLASIPRAIILLLMVIVVALASLLGLHKLTSSLLERRTLDFFGYYCLLLGAFAFTYIVAGF